MNWKKAEQILPPVGKKILLKTRVRTDSEYYGPDLGNAVVAGTFRAEKRKNFVKVDGTEGMYRLEYSEHIWFEDEEIDPYAIEGKYFSWVEFPE